MAAASPTLTAAPLATPYNITPRPLDPPEDPPIKLDLRQDLEPSGCCLDLDVRPFSKRAIVVKDGHLTVFENKISWWARIFCRCSPDPYLSMNHKDAIRLYERYLAQQYTPLSARLVSCRVGYNFNQMSVLNMMLTVSKVKKIAAAMATAMTAWKPARESSFRKELLHLKYYLLAQKNPLLLAPVNPVSRQMYVYNGSKTTLFDKSRLQATLDYIFAAEELDKVVRDDIVAKVETTLLSLNQEVVSTHQITCHMVAATASVLVIPSPELYRSLEVRMAKEAPLVIFIITELCTKEFFHAMDPKALNHLFEALPRSVVPQRREASAKIYDSKHAQPAAPSEQSAAAGTASAQSAAAPLPFLVVENNSPPLPPRIQAESVVVITNPPKTLLLAEKARMIRQQRLGQRALSDVGEGTEVAGFESSKSEDPKEKDPLEAV
jgi:hypothetical protein